MPGEIECVGWRLDLWDGDGHGLRVDYTSADEGNPQVAFSLIATKGAILFHGGKAELKQYFVPGVGNPQMVNKQKLDNDDVLENFGGLVEPSVFRLWVRQLAALVAADPTFGERP